MSFISLSSRTSRYKDPNLGSKTSFYLTYKNELIFERDFDSNLPSIVNLSRSQLSISNHFFTTGEEVEYFYIPENGHVKIGIAETVVSGVTTSFIPDTAYIVKISPTVIKLAATAEDALLPNPKTFTFTNYGVGQHKLISKNANKKCIITLDNIIQSPVVSTSTTSYLTQDCTSVTPIIIINDPDLFVSGDLIKIDNEYMRIYTIESNGEVIIERNLLGTLKEPHLSGSVISKIDGDYNIIDNFIHFANAPYGNELERLSRDLSGSELEYTNLDARSKFSGRVFLRSGIPLTSDEAYSKNHIFDSLSEDFTPDNDTYTLTENGQNVTGFAEDNAVLLINNIFQSPSRVEGNLIVNSYNLTENNGVSSITFVGNKTSPVYDINATDFPRSGIIVSVGSTNGFGYQPLVCAGGTAIVNNNGSIESISIGNSGSGYRSGIQTVNVGVQTFSLGVPEIFTIGTAVVQNGYVVDVNITNPGSNYDQQNPPLVIFDDPLSYSNIPLKYSSNNTTIGNGDGAQIDIFVSQDTSVSYFNMTNYGYGYKKGDILTVDIGGPTGIPTTNSGQFEEFSINVDKVYNDRFFAWTLGQFQLFDKIDDLFDGERTIFPLDLNGERISIRSKLNSRIETEATLLVIINGILQTPYKSYEVIGGSLIYFNEPPDAGDKCDIIFYRGTRDVDTKFKEVLNPLEEGDSLKIYSSRLPNNQDKRTIEDIISSNTVETNIYGGRGILKNSTLARPVNIYPQREDLIINGREENKIREIYEPLISPRTYLISPVGSSTTEFFVENLKTFFDDKREYEFPEEFQNTVKIISQEEVRPAIGTAIVNQFDQTIDSIQIIDGGYGYKNPPSVVVSLPSTTNAVSCSAVTYINNVGVVTDIQIINPGFGYTTSTAPLVIIEEPTVHYEVFSDVVYDGDFGDVISIDVGAGSTSILFDLFIPPYSQLRDTNINTLGISTLGISGIKTGYYVSISNTKVGSEVESLTTDNQSIGISSSTNLNNVYQVKNYSLVQKNIPGIGTTDIVRIECNISQNNSISGLTDFSYYGNYSWGKISNVYKSTELVFNSYSPNISTSAVVQRYNNLAYLNYIT